MIVVCPFFVSRYLSYRSAVFPWRQVVLPQFWLARRDSTSSKYGCWGSLCFVVIFSAFFLGFSGRVCSVVGASVFAATIYRCGARHCHYCNLPDHIPSSLRSSCSFLRFILDDPLSASHSRRPSLFITTFSARRRGESEWITRSRSPKHRRRESEWISLRLMDSPTFLINFALSMLWCSTSFYQCASCRLNWWQSTLHHTSFPRTDIHVWLPSQRHPSRRYILHLDTWGLDTLLASIALLLILGVFWTFCWL